MPQRSRSELDEAERVWPADLPQGVIHADLFPDNVFFLGDRLSGLIDFYFACNDMLAYDVAVCLNAWCFETDGSLNVTKARALLTGYAAVRPLSAAEIDALPMLARGSALRFLLTRLYDWLTVPDGRAGGAEGPARILPQAALPPQRQRRLRLRAQPVTREAHQHLERRRLLGQSRPRRLGRACSSGTGTRRS